MIELTYKGRDGYRTLLGGIVSILVYIIAFLISLALLINYINGNSASYSRSTLNVDFTNENPTYSLKDTDFRFAFSVSDGTYDGFSNTNQYTFEMRQYSVDGTTTTPTTVTLKRCGDDFPTKGEKRLTNYLCPSNWDFSVQGDSLATKRRYFDIKLKRNTSATGTFPEGAIVKVVLVNGYFDPEDFDDPTKTFIDTRYEYVIRSGQHKDVKMFVRKGMKESLESSFQFGQGGNKDTMYSVEESYVQTDVDPSPTDYFTATFAIDSVYNKHASNKENVWDFLGAVGGIIALISGIGAYFVLFFARPMFVYDTIANMYQVDIMKDDNPGGYADAAQEGFHAIRGQLNYEGGSSEEEEDEPDEDEAEGEEESYQGVDDSRSREQPVESKPKSPKRTREEEKKESELEGKKKRKEDEVLKPSIKRKLVKEAKVNMENRRRYNWSYFDLAYNLFWPNVLKSGRWFCNRPMNLHDRYELFKLGEAKFTEEFDCFHIVHSLRDLGMLVGSLLDDSERYLGIYQQTRCISLRQVKEAKEEEQPQDESSLPKLLDKHGKSEEHEQAVKEFFRKYIKEKFTSRDYKLLRGIFSTVTMKNDEIQNLMNDSRELGESVVDSVYVDNKSDWPQTADIFKRKE